MDSIGDLSLTADPYGPALPVQPAGAPEPVWELATMYPAQGDWTEEEYLSLTDGSNRLIEFTDGRLEFLAMPTRAHQRILKVLFLALTKFVDERGLGEVLPTGMRIKMRDGKHRMPDIVYLSKDQEAEWGGERFFDGVDIAIEIVSDDHKSHNRDYSIKVEDYAEGRIPEYWIVDPQELKITVLSLAEGADAYTEHGVFTPGDSARSKLLEGFAVDVQATFDAAKA